MRCRSRPFRTTRLTLERTLKHLALLLAFSFAFTACGDSATDPLQVESVEIEAPATLAPGETAQATATVQDTDGNVIPDPPLEWNSSDPTIAEVASTGLISAIDTGIVVITATAAGVSDELELIVREDPCLTPVGALLIDETVEGELTEQSCLLESWFHDPWQLEIDEDIQLQINLESAEFDAFILLTDAAGEFIAEDDDGGDGNDARLEIALTTGTYFVWASTFDEEDTGTYVLSVTEIAEGGGTSSSAAAGGSVSLERIPALRIAPERRKP